MSSAAIGREASTAERVGAPIVLGVVVVALWQLLAGSGLIEAYLLPSPLAIGQEIAEFLPSMLSAAGLTTLVALRRCLGCGLLRLGHGLMLGTRIPMLTGIAGSAPIVLPAPARSSGTARARR